MSSMQTEDARRLTLFVHRASELLTDHESHGDGLICFSLLNGLAARGHRIFAYSDRVAIHACSPQLQARSERHRVPANSLIPWEQSRRAERWLRRLSRMEEIDLVWRMQPIYGMGYPHMRRLLGKPLVVGPIFYSWPREQAAPSSQARPRLGISLNSMTAPAIERGWNRTLQRAALQIYTTEPHADAMRPKYPRAQVMALPLIVDPPDPARAISRSRAAEGPFRLIFVANLLPYKKPILFCEIIKRLRDMGLDVEGHLLGDGPERPALEDYCRAQGIQHAVCFAGKVPNTEVYLRLMEADMLVSLSYGEPYGRSIAEAMSVGTPCACHRSGGPADFITEGIDGLLVPDLSATAYAEQIARLVVDPARWRALSIQAATHAAQWTSEAVLSRLETGLLDLCRKSEKRERR